MLTYQDQFTCYLTCFGHIKLPTTLRHGYLYVFLRVWQEWDIENNTFVAMVMREGDKCADKQRSVKVCTYGRNCCVLFTWIILFLVNRLLYITGLYIPDGQFAHCFKIAGSWKSKSSVFQLILVLLFVQCAKQFW